MAKPVLRFALFAGFGAFAIGGLYFGYVFFAHTKAAVQTIFVSPIPEVVFAAPTATPAPPALAGAPEPTPAATAVISGTPVVVATREAIPPDWSQKERVNILVMGIDQREDEVTRTDTMIVVSVDPYTRTANLLSIPRDLWVSIPGFYAAKINAAYPFGEMNHVPGGGPGLAEATLQEDLGIPINYFLTINFQGFKRLIDQLGGIDIDVPSYLRDDQYPTEDYGYQTVIFEPGMQHMDGERALQYSRTRHADSDFGRMRRQQQVIMAVREKALSLGVIPKIPQLIGSFAETMKTDLSPTQAVSLARLLGSIPNDKITMKQIDETMTVDQWYGDQEALTPQWDKIDPMIAELFADSRLKEEAATVEVLNGTNEAGLARRASDYLAKFGFNVVNVAQASGTYTQSELRVFTDKSYSQKRLLQLLGLSSSSVREGAPGTSTADLQVILGDDFKPAQ